MGSHSLMGASLSFVDDAVMVAQNGNVFNAAEFIHLKMVEMVNFMLCLFNHN